MGLNTSVQQFVERLNDLNCYLLYFPEENPKQLDQDEIIEILDQAKDMDPEWHEAMVNAIIDIFEMSYEESVSYFKRLEKLEKIRHTNGPNPSSLTVYNKKTDSVTNSVGKPSKNHNGFTMKAGPEMNNLAFLFEEIDALKSQLNPEKTANSKKRKKEG
jgi:predicted AlkP superfamily pyrophosphatase or phosphodiesterase